MKKNNNSARTIFMGLAIAINLIGGFIAIALKLPIYIDTIGTLFISVVFGPISGAVVGGLSSIVNFITFDPISLYFIPVQVAVGISAGLLFKNGDFKGIKSILSIIVVTLINSIAAAIIVSFVFGGITTSGSSILVTILKNSGINIITSVFSTQIFTDLLDKAISFGIVFTIIKMLPVNIKNKITERK